MKAKIIVISYNYSPLVNPRSLRWTRLCEKLVALGCEVHVVSSLVTSTQAYEHINGVHVHRVGVRSQAHPCGESQLVNKTSQVKSVLKFIYNYFVKYIMWPDSNFLWIKRAVKKSNEIISAQGIQSVVSVSHPFSGHVVGYQIHKKNKSLNWLMDIGDPFAFLEFVKINNSFLYKKFNSYYEKKCIKTSNYQSVTTDLTKAMYLKLGYECSKKMHIMPPILTKTPSVQKDAAGESKKWVFIGTLYRQIRSPAYLLRLFVEFIKNNPEHELHFYGEYKMCIEDFADYKDLLDRKIFLHGLVSPDIAQKAIESSYLLVNIGNKTSYQLPSKLVEYMSFGALILNIKSIENDSSEDFLKNYPAAVFISEQLTLVTALQKITHKLLQQSNLSLEEAKPYVESFKVDVVAQQYLNLLK